MPRADDLAEITRALSVPLGDLIAAVGRGVAEAQRALDLHTLESFRAVYGEGAKAYEEFRRLGYQPTWYRIPEVSAEISVALSASGHEQLEVEKSRPAEGDEVQRLKRPATGRVRLNATPIDASFSNSYDYNVRASSRIVFKVVAVPPAAAAEGLKVAPGLTKLPVAEARRLLDELGIPYEFDDRFYEPRDEDVVDSTLPAGGEFLTEGRLMRLSVKRPET
jgi:hypothetical protein